MSSMVTIMSSTVANDLFVAKTYLEANDIICFVQDELMNRAYPGVTGGAKLCVTERDAIRAAELLIEGNFATKEDFEIPESTMRMVRIYEKITDFFKKKQ